MGILNISLALLEMTNSHIYRIDPSLWVERLCEFFRCRRQPEARGQEKLPARCPKTSPLGLESTKARDEAVAYVILEDEQQLARISCVKQKEAAAMEDTSGRLRKEIIKYSSSISMAFQASRVANPTSS
ncbi:hypothetical protein A3841_06545 [Pontibacter flavimaris]|uniref:Uncharacterized protein n=1 Tax=Pontibacter flavimaris TaxID=1797110 RepID=A0A1Q5P976_9BACT|nr:hypothetical protein A3841_06545 [Pontibacter flavimaris]